MLCCSRCIHAENLPSSLDHETDMILSVAILRVVENPFPNRPDFTELSLVCHYRAERCVGAKSISQSSSLERGKLAALRTAVQLEMNQENAKR